MNLALNARIDIRCKHAPAENRVKHTREDSHGRADEKDNELLAAKTRLKDYEQDSERNTE